MCDSIILFHCWDYFLPMESSESISFVCSWICIFMLYFLQEVSQTEALQHQSLEQTCQNHGINPSSPSNVSSNTGELCIIDVLRLEQFCFRFPCNCDKFACWCLDFYHSSVELGLAVKHGTAGSSDCTSRRASSSISGSRIGRIIIRVVTQHSSLTCLWRFNGACTMWCVQVVGGSVLLAQVPSG